MKKILFCIALLFCVLTINAQDVLVTDDGDAIKAYNVEVATNKVYYTLDPKSEDSKSILKSKVLVWKKADGTKVVLAQGDNNNATQANNANTPSSDAPTVESLSAELVEENKKLIDEINSRNLSYIKKDTTKRATGVYLVYGIKPGSVLKNKNIEVSFEIFSSFIRNDFYVKIHNLSNNTVYIDLAKSYLLVTGQEADFYYSPSATQSSEGSSSGMSVNVGALTGALGIGGVLGTLAGGVNVGGGNSSSTTQVTYAQRFAVLPPMSSKTLDSKNFFIDAKLGQWFQKDKHGEYLIKRGQFVNIPSDKIEYPVNLNLVYYQNENATTPNVLQVYFGIKKIVGCVYYEYNQDSKLEYTTQHPFYHKKEL